MLPNPEEVKEALKVYAYGKGLDGSTLNLGYDIEQDGFKLSCEGMNEFLSLEKFAAGESEKNLKDLFLRAIDRMAEKKHDGK